jgi:glycosyltransferase involved in cell wall biosynthesis
VIEAMLTGLPVVATDIRGCREQVLPEVTGLLIPPGQSAPLAAAIERLLLDPALGLRMGAMARQRALVLYDETKVLQSQLDLYGQAVAALKSRNQALLR